MLASKKINKNDSDRTVIGKISATHGVRGTMIIFPLTDYPERFLDMREIVLEKIGRPARRLKVKSITPYIGKGTFFFKAEGVDDKETAETYKGSMITVANDERVELPEDEFWIDDIVGMKVVESESGAELGTVEDILLTGSNDVYIVRTGNGLKPIPAIASVIKGIDVENSVMTVIIPDGLWD